MVEISLDNMMGRILRIEMDPNRNGNVVAARVESNANRNHGNQIRCYNYRGLGHLARNCIVRPRRRYVVYLQTQLLIAQKEEAGIQLQTDEFDLMVAALDLDEIEEVNEKCILMANLQQASTSGTKTDKTPVYDSDRSAEVQHFNNCYNNDIFNMFTQEEQYTELLEPIPEPHQVHGNDSNVIYEVFSVEQTERTKDQHHATVEETQAYLESLYNNLAIEVEKVNTVNRKLRETNADLTNRLARYKNQEKRVRIPFMGKREDVGDDLNGGVGSAIYRVKEAFVPKFSSWIRWKILEGACVVYLEIEQQGDDVYMAVFGQPTPVSLLVVIMVTVVVVVVMVILVIVVIAIVRVVIIVAIIGIVFIVDGGSSILKLLFVIIDFLCRIVFYYLLHQPMGYEFGTMFGHKTANSWNLIIVRIPFMGKREDMGDDLNGGVGSAIYNVKEDFVPKFSSWISLRAGE
nr:hypothetical protein [Tanacetum cinerariifolium]